MPPKHNSTKKDQDGPKKPPCEETQEEDSTVSPDKQQPGRNKRPAGESLHTVQLTPNTRSRYRVGSSPAAAVPAVIDESQYGIHLTTRATKNGTGIVVISEGRDGKNCFDFPFIDLMQKEEEKLRLSVTASMQRTPTLTVKQKLKICLIKNHVHPNNPLAELRYPSRTPGGFEPSKRVFFTRTLDPSKNTPENREKQVRAMCAFNNSTEVQKHGYGNDPGHMRKNNLMTFAGDLTPSNLADAPPLSDFLTVGDVMQFLAEDFTNADGQMPTDLELVSDPVIMENWFNPSIHEQVRSLYSEDGSQAPGFNLPTLDF